MLWRLLKLGLRGLYAGIAVGGLLLVRYGYPPSGSDPPVLLFFGVILAGVGLMGTVWPEKIRSSNSIERSD